MTMTATEPGAAVTTRLMTTEELLALPEDGMDRELIRGRRKQKRMTRRNRRHSRMEGKFALVLGQWLERQPQPRGEILVGEAGVRLRRDPDTTVGIDVAYISALTADGTAEDAFLVEGAPVLCVEILSPNDAEEDIADKVTDSLDAGVKLVWVVDPVFRTVVVYRPDAKPKLFNEDDELTGEAHLPGFGVPVRALFRR